MFYSPIIDVEKLRSNAWKGIPLRYHPQVWHIFLDYEHSNTTISSSVLIEFLMYYRDIYGQIRRSKQKHKCLKIYSGLLFNLLKMKKRINCFSNEFYLYGQFGIQLRGMFKEWMIFYYHFFSYFDIYLLIVYIKKKKK